MLIRLLFAVTIGLGLQRGSLIAASETNTATFLRQTVRSMDSLDNHQKLGPGDRITYRVIEDQDEPRTLLITDSGDLEVPYLGLVHAAGKTCLELARQIKGLLEKNLYYKATVMISAEVINKTRVTGKVYVTGQVRNSGGYDIPAGDTLTVSRAILNAGGFSDFADKRKVQLVRKSAAGQESRIVDVQDIWEKGRLDQDPVVRPGDLIVVRDRLFKW
jgi:polysaccharide biosynthesis/export protein